MSTCNRLDLETLIATNYAPKSLWTLEISVRKVRQRGNKPWV